MRLLKLKPQMSVLRKIYFMRGMYLAIQEITCLCIEHDVGKLAKKTSIFNMLNALATVPTALFNASSG